jgi:hypothetical protein
MTEFKFTDQGHRFHVFPMTAIGGVVIEINDEIQIVATTIPPHAHHRQSVRAQEIEIAAPRMDWRDLKTPESDQIYRDSIAAHALEHEFQAPPPNASWCLKAARDIVAYLLSKPRDPSISDLIMGIPYDQRSDILERIATIISTAGNSADV